MALKLPASAFTKLNEAILLFNRTCTIVYPEKKEKCGNCVANTIGGRSTNFYRSGGPIPFERGNNCPLCGGAGFKLIESTDSVELRIYYNRRDFIDVGFNADVPNNVIQTVGYADDYQKLTKCKELLVDVGKHNQGRYKRISEPYNQGFKQNPTQYIVLFWERI
tara:strand:+ start:102 stop:593 length:492 start_codon:yes stop_codon:yes gene_type:complete